MLVKFLHKTWFKNYVISVYTNYINNMLSNNILTLVLADLEFWEHKRNEMSFRANMNF
jgi:hypothetical protein